jgi:hypothetical protein
MSLKFDPAWLAINDVDERYWAFYKVNEKEYNKILWDAAWKHKNTITPEDMHSDLLVRMHRSDFLTSFDPSKSLFGTFVTGRVLGYASHILTSHLNETKGLNRALCSGLNYIEEDGADASSELNSIDEIVTEEDLPVESTVDISLFDDTIMQELNRILLPLEARIFQYFKTGYSHSEIARRIKQPNRKSSSINWVRAHVNSINEKIRRVFTGIKILSKSKKDLTPYEEKVLQGLWLKGFLIKEGDTYITKNAIKEKKKKKNGHVKAKKRKLSEYENELIKSLFVSANGMIREDTSLKMKALVGKDISIFQITGKIVGLHKLVLKGELVLRDFNAYKKVMDNHRKKWATYKSSKYQTPKYQAALV